jgi:hypothetical protein
MLGARREKLPNGLGIVGVLKYGIGIVLEINVVPQGFI